MSTTITDYIDVDAKITELGCRRPNNISLLPINFDSALSVAELRHASEAATIKKLLLAEAIPLEEITGKEQRPLYVKNKSSEWVAPLVFISASLYSQNPALVSVALGVIANYATEFLRGRAAEEVKLNVVVETRNKTYKKLAYKGPVDGLKELPNIIREVCE